MSHSSDSNIDASPQPGRGLRVAVIGGGVSGLAAAHRLRELRPQLEVWLFEAGPTLGGVLQTDHENGFLIERSADMFITNPACALDLCRRAGLEDELISTNEDRRKAFVVFRGKLIPVPDGFSLMTTRRPWPILTTPLLSLSGKLRLLGEFFVPRRKEDGDESLASFVRRRLGREAFERLVQPLVAGIYTADAEKLSIQAALPRFPEMERQHGGLIRAALRNSGGDDQRGQSGARYGMFMAPRQGMASLPGALAARLPAESIVLNTPVKTMNSETGGSWRLTFGVDRPDETFDAVIVSTPAARASHLLSAVDDSLARELAAIPAAGAAVVCLGYRREQIRHPLDGFGFVVPEIENRPILAGSFSSVKFNGRAPQGHVLLRVFLGGATHPEVVELDDAKLSELSQQQLAELLEVEGSPVLQRISRWQGVMPQYHVGHLLRVEKIEQRVAVLAGLELSGNAFRGVGVPHCIHSGETAAERTAAHLFDEPT